MFVYFDEMVFNSGRSDAFESGIDCLFNTGNESGVLGRGFGGFRFGRAIEDCGWRYAFGHKYFKYSVIRYNRGYECRST
jgi:hypothetical protein